MKRNYAHRISIKNILPGLSHRAQLLVGLGLVIVVMGSIASSVLIHKYAEHQAQQALQSKLTTQQASQKSPDSKSTAATVTQTQTTPTATAGSSTKYATSSDPRSTAYSTTPPAANPASFAIQITHPGQVSPGTKISYNATKNETTYYGGDFVLSQSNFSFTQAAGGAQSIAISTPDGQVANAPAKAWNDQGDYRVNITNQGGTYPGPASSWNMLISVSAGTPAGTYQIHLQSFRTTGSDSWEYDGFVTVTIISM